MRAAAGLILLGLTALRGQDAKPIALTTTVASALPCVMRPENQPADLHQPGRPLRFGVTLSER